MIKFILKKYWLHLIIIVSVITAFAALMNYDIIIVVFSYAGLAVLSAYAGMLLARCVFNLLKKRFDDYV